MIGICDLWIVNKDDLWSDPQWDEDDQIWHFVLQSATALGGTRAMMVLLLSVFILKEVLTLWKVRLLTMQYIDCEYLVKWPYRCLIYVLYTDCSHRNECARNFMFCVRIKAEIRWRWQRSERYSIWLYPLSPCNCHICIQWWYVDLTDDLSKYKWL